MNLSNEQLFENLKRLGLVNGSVPISYSGFKNRASIHRYGKKHKIVFIGHPKENLFGFYTMYGTDSDVMKEAYEIFIRVLKGGTRDYELGDVQWGNAGIPISYSNLRQIDYL